MPAADDLHPDGQAGLAHATKDAGCRQAQLVAPRSEMREELIAHWQLREWHGNAWVDRAEDKFAAFEEPIDGGAHIASLDQHPQQRLTGPAPASAGAPTPRRVPPG